MVIDLQKGAGNFALDVPDGKAGHPRDLIVRHRIETHRQEYLTPLPWQRLQCRVEPSKHPCLSEAFK